MVEPATAEELCAKCDPAALGFASTAEVDSLEGIIGQERALKALRFGLEIKEKGFNLFAAGEPGTGKNTAVSGFLNEAARDKEAPSDWCYVYNFRDAYKPRALPLPAGRAAEFSRRVWEFIDGVRREIKTAFRSEEYQKRKATTLESIAAERNELMGMLKKEADEAGFMLQSTPVGFLIIPMGDEGPMKEAQFAALPEETRKQIMARRKDLEAKIDRTMRRLQRLERSSREKVLELDHEITRFVLDKLTGPLRDDYQGLEEVRRYLGEVEADILDNLAFFKEDKEKMPPAAGEFFNRYKVNVVVDNSSQQGAPVIFDESPLYGRLVGKIEREARMGALVTDFTMIRAGVLHRANGGYLVLPVLELFTSPFTWEALKRALQEQKIIIDEPSDRLGIFSTKSLEPEPIPLNIKVILMGDARAYQVLYAVDHSFRELFKVKAEFDTRMERNPENIQMYARFTATLSRKESLRHLDAGGVARLVEYGCREAGDQQQLSTRFADLADIVREADCYAARDEASYITAAHITEAVESRLYRADLPRERLAELIRNETLLIDVDGVEVGQVNGLSVLSPGDMAFGRPSRITATVGCGRGGVIDIEREAKLGGRLHSKGVLILGGYLLSKFGGQRPLNVAARLVFEQSYSKIDGDSASSAELYALLSALSGIGVRQDLAVTGSVNQKGDVQPVGGVNEKIEGFFEACRIKGFTGTQGVIIPRANMRHLMLRDEVTAAVSEGRFHIYPVETVDEGMEVLTGRPAGESLPDGGFPEGTINGAVAARLAAMDEKTPKERNENNL